MKATETRKWRWKATTNDRRYKRKANLYPLCWVSSLSIHSASFNEEPFLSAPITLRNLLLARARSSNMSPASTETWKLHLREGRDARRRRVSPSQGGAAQNMSGLMRDFIPMKGTYIC